MYECYFMAHQQLWSFSTDILVLKDNKSGISKVKKKNKINISMVAKGYN